MPSVNALSTELLARGQMAYSLGFHIIFAAIGIAMPVFMVAAEICWLRTRDPEYLALARRWTKGTAVFFAVGAVSGTVLSFELGLLFPTFMKHAGALIGLPFSLEGFAFFTEAIFLGIYLYGWNRVRPRLHVAAGIIVAVSGLLSAIFVTLANAWMNTPRGFRFVDRQFVEIDPLAAMATPFAAHEVPHTVLAAYMSTAFAVAAIHAWRLYRQPTSTFHRKALAIALAMAIPTALVQPFVGHFAGQQVGRHQPLKLAAIEQLAHTQSRAPLHLGPIEIPGALSFLAFSDFDARVQGLDAFPREDWPPSIVRPAFQVMVLLGMLAAGYSLFTMLWWFRRRRLPSGRAWLLATVALGPTGVVAMEAGWVVTEVGRQPWIIYGILRTRDSITPVTGLWLPFVTFALIYATLAVIVCVVLYRQVRHTADEAGS